MAVTVVLGTRPEIIKLGPVLRELAAWDIPYRLVHTGQHYSPNLDGIFFEELGLGPPDVNLRAGSGTHAEEVARILVGVEGELVNDRPDAALVLGDTNSTLGGALAASKLHVPLGHIEAGLRSYDRHMPEELNRVLTDHCADRLFAPTPKAQAILHKEGIADERVLLTGNTIVDAVRQNLELARSKVDIADVFGLSSKGYVLVTAHREENVDDPARLGGILDGLGRVRAALDMPVVYPMHPRTRKCLDRFGLSEPAGVTFTDPVGFLEFLQLEANARIVLTDSGGIQEETCVLGVPCVTLRDNTERPETLEVGSNVLAGTSPERILSCAEEMVGRKGDWRNPFGDGKAAVRIVEDITGSSWME
jgi:UDP-N-acetylglucosamine 2-epimerase (non-hydrolysing)